MQQTTSTFSAALLALLQLAFIRMVSRLVVGLPPEDVRARILALPIADRAGLILTWVVALALATSLFAEAGTGGVLAFWGTLWALLR